MLKTTLLLFGLLVCPVFSWALRIVSLVPSNTEIVEALGAGEEIVGVTIFDETKPGRKVIGDFLNPSMELIVSLKPDVILGGNWENVKTVPELRRMGYRVIEVAVPQRLSDIDVAIRQVADAIGQPKAAEPVIRSMKTRIDQIAKRGRALPRRFSTFIEIDTGLWTVSANDFISEAVLLCGGDNIFAELKAIAGQVSSESVVARKPELIIAFSMPKSVIAKRPGWASLPAVRQGRILDDIPHTLTHPSPRIVEGMEALISRMESLEPKR